MAELRFAVLFEAIDAMSAKVNKISNSFKKLDEQVSRSMRATGEAWMRTGAIIGGVGAAALVGITKGFIDPAAEMQDAMLRVDTALSANENRTRINAEVLAFANKTAQQGVISAKQLADAYYIARSNGADHAAALTAVAASARLVTGTTENAAAAQAAMVDTTRTLTDLQNIYGVSATKLADRLSNLQSKYGFANIQEIREGLSLVAPVAAPAGISIDTLSASLAVLSENMKHAGEGGAALRNVLIEFERGGAKNRLVPFQRANALGQIDIIKSVEALKSYLAKLTPLEAEGFLAKAGFQARSLAGVEILLKHLERIKAVQAGQAQADGVAQKNAATRLEAFNQQSARLANTWEVFRRAIGDALLPSVTNLAKYLSEALIAATNFVKTHEQLTAWIAKATAISAIALIIAGAFIAVAGAILFLASFGGVAIGGLIAILVGIPALLASRVSGGFAKLGSDIKGYASQAISDYESFLNSINWAAVGTSIGKLVGKGIIAIIDFIHHTDWLGVGKEIIKLIAEGILAGADLVGAAVGTTAKVILEHFVGHSPPPRGPLHYIDRVNIVETIADTMKPAPVVSAAHNVAQAMLAAMPSLISPVLMMQPNTLGAAAPFYSDQFRHLAERGSSGRGGVNIHLDYHPTFNGATPQDFDPKQHADIIMRQIRSQLIRENTLRFDR